MWVFAHHSACIAVKGQLCHSFPSTCLRWAFLFCLIASDKYGRLAGHGASGESPVSVHSSLQECYNHRPVYCTSGYLQGLLGFDLRVSHWHSKHLYSPSQLSKPPLFAGFLQKQLSESLVTVLAHVSTLPDQMCLILSTSPSLFLNAFSGLFVF